MTLAEMRVLLRRKIGNPTTSDVPDSLLSDLLNEANRYIMDAFPFHMSRTLYQFPTVAGTARYQLPADCGALLKVGNRTERYRIVKRDIRTQMRTDNELTDHKGKPQWYSRARDWIQFSPIPDAVYQIGLFYKNTIADLVLDTDESETPVTWHRGIVSYARYLFYDEKQDYAKAQYAYASWTLWLGNKPSELQEEQLHDDEMGAELPSLRQGDPDSGHYRRGGWDYDE